MLSPVAALCSFGVVSLLGLVLLLVYRLYLSPLAKFPGPKLAAATLWYETYYDVFCWGRYGFEIEKMHEKYGPIVRISPYEIHINDPDFYEFSITRSMISTVDHYHHRMLRSNMNPYFSIARVRKHEPVIRALVDKLLDRLQAYKGTGAPVNLQHAFTCFTTDVVSDYTMGAGYNYLDEPDFIPSWSDTLAGSAKTGVYIRVWPWLGLLFSVMPPWLLLKIYPGMGLVSQFQARCNSIVQSIMEEHNAKGYEKVKSRFDRLTFFHDVLNSDLPPEEKEPGRLAQEVQVVIGAGAETTAKMLAWTIYYLLESPEKMNKLKEELNRLDPKGTATLLDYEQMPYLICVMLEGLRLSYGVSTRLQRIAPDRDLQFNKWTIPAGTPVGMSSMLIHHNEDIFPDSRNFVPERWEDPEKRRRLEKYLVSFTKGSRQCIGINLARSEILLALPKIVRGLELKLFETTREDVTLTHDLFLPFAKEGRKGIRVLVN